MQTKVSLAEYIRTYLYTQAWLICRQTDTILKADLWNEEKGEVPLELPGKIFNVEFSYLRTLKAKAPRKICGNIRALPFRDNTFDVALDLSTIDHQAAYGAFLTEYHRVLKPGGKILVASWLTEGTIYTTTEIACDQWVFDDKDFTQEVLRYFPDAKSHIFVDKEMAKAIWAGSVTNMDGVYMKVFIGSKCVSC